MNADLCDGYLGLDDYRWLWKAALAGVRVIAIIETDERQEVVSVHRSDSSVIAIESDATGYNQIYKGDTAEDFAKFNDDCEDLGLRWLMPTGHVIQEAIYAAYGEAVQMKHDEESPEGVSSSPAEGGKP